MAALSLPVKDVADAMGEDYSPKKKKEEKSDYRQNKSSFDLNESRTGSSSVMTEKGGLRLPNTNLNQAKLKVILKQLKSMDRKKDSYSARYD